MVNKICFWIFKKKVSSAIHKQRSREQKRRKKDTNEEKQKGLDSFVKEETTKLYEEYYTGEFLLFYYRYLDRFKTVPTSFDDLLEFSDYTAFDSKLNNLYRSISALEGSYGK